MDKGYQGEAQRNTTTHTTGVPPPHVQRLSKIPDELKRVRRWMGTVFVPRPGKPGKVDKPPYRVRSGQPVVQASKSEPENWSTFAEALAAYERGDVDAIGIVLTADDPYFALDEDDVIDLDTGEVDATAHHIVHALGTYAEISCSGRGLRAVGIGSKPEYAGCKSREFGFGVEVYDGTNREGESAAAFLVMTGNHLPGTPEGVEDRQRELDALCRQLWPKKKKPRRSKAKASGAHTVDEEALLQRARRARTGAKFRRLYDRGDVTGYASESEADFGLLNMLCFWTAGDADRMARLFEQSALHRPDEKHARYVEISVDECLATYTGRFYRPRRVDSLKRDERQDALAPYLALLLDPSAWTGPRGASGFKAFAALVVLAAEHGVDADGELRAGADVRRLAEIAGMALPTMSRSALPYLVAQKRIRWQRGKGKNAGAFVLLKQNLQTDNTRITTHFSVISCQVFLDTLRLLVRMRSGRDKCAILERQGPLVMFATTALLSAPARGYRAREWREAMGRKVYGKRWRELVARMKAAGIVREREPGCYTLTDHFRQAYEAQLKRSGIVDAEKRQKKRHAEDRRKRDEALAARKRPDSGAEDVIKRSDAKLRGPEEVERTLERNAPEYRRRCAEDERQKAGQTALTFLSDAMKGRAGFRFRELVDLWRERGGGAATLASAVRAGPFRLAREASDRDNLYVYHDGRTA